MQQQSLTKYSGQLKRKLLRKHWMLAAVCLLSSIRQIDRLPLTVIPIGLAGQKLQNCQECRVIFFCSAHSYWDTDIFK